MRIAVFGAGGAVGSRVVAEALARGHEVTAVARRAIAVPTGVRLLIGDASDAEKVEKLSGGQDLVIAATRPTPGSESELPVVAAAMLAGVARSGTRLLVVGGAATLVVPGAGLPLHETPDFPSELAAIARACAEQLAACRADVWPTGPTSVRRRSWPLVRAPAPTVSAPTNCWSTSMAPRRSRWRISRSPCSTKPSGRCIGRSASQLPLHDSRRAPLSPVTNR
ncbi:NAD(P)-dependent oxidoreductase [Nocardia asteroides]|uniref:NAD(P)-dependent oxidoreductase n=1 Tax=Nocardia asteroides TaxID=1824 RepID=UPI0033ECDC32